jgi:hypothetical protein
MKIGDYLYAEGFNGKSEIVRETQKQWVLHNGDRVWKSSLEVVNSGSTWTCARRYVEETEEAKKMFAFLCLNRKYVASINHMIKTCHSEKNEQFMRDVVELVNNKDIAK